MKHRIVKVEEFTGNVYFKIQVKRLLFWIDYTFPFAHIHSINEASLNYYAPTFGTAANAEKHYTEIRTWNYRGKNILKAKNYSGGNPEYVFLNLNQRPYRNLSFPVYRWASSLEGMKCSIDSRLDSKKVKLTIV